MSAQSIRQYIHKQSAERYRRHRSRTCNMNIHISHRTDRLDNLHYTLHIHQFTQNSNWLHGEPRIITCTETADNLCWLNIRRYNLSMNMHHNRQHDTIGGQFIGLWAGCRKKSYWRIAVKCCKSISVTCVRGWQESHVMSGYFAVVASRRLAVPVM